MKKLLILIPCFAFLFSCQNDSVSTEKSVEEVQAMITDNPVTRDAPSKQIRKEQVQTPKDTVNVSRLDFENKVFEFGIVDEGERVEHTFKFKNTGKVPLVINDAKGSCGCTVPKWPKEPIPVGETGEIKISFNTSGKRNKQTKTVTLTANTYPANTVLTIKGEVIPKNKPTNTKSVDSHAGHDHSHDGHDHTGHNH